MSRTLDCGRTSELISADLDGELDADESASLRAHLDACRTCRDAYEEMSALHRMFRVRPAEDVPDLSQQILDRADAPVQAPRRASTARVRGRYVLSAAAIILLVAGVVVARPTGGPEPLPALGQISGVATPGRQGSSGAIYLEFVNEGGGDTLTGARTSTAERATLHVTETRDGMVVMEDEDTRPIAGHGTTVFGPGGTHVMLNGLADDLEPGKEIEVTLVFERSGERTIEVPIVPHAELPDLYWSSPA